MAVSSVQNSGECSASALARSGAAGLGAASTVEMLGVTVAVALVVRAANPAAATQPGAMPAWRCAATRAALRATG